MRASSYMILVFSFVCGIAGSILVAATFFWQKAEVTLPKTLVPILVAKEDLPAGVELTAPLLRFELVDIEELPEGALARFSDAVHHRTLYPISRDYPVCRDMIASRREPTTSTDQFVPVGFRVVSLEVRQPAGSNESLAADQRLHLFVDTGDRPGRLAAMRNEVVGPSPLKCVLEGVLVEAVTESIDETGDLFHTVSLLLTSEQKESLVAAAEQGRLRVAIASTAEISRHTAEISERVEIAEKIAEPVVEVAVAVAAAPVSSQSVPSLSVLLPEPGLPEPDGQLPIIKPIVPPVPSTLPTQRRAASFVTPSHASLQRGHAAQEGREPTVPYPSTPFSPFAAQVPTHELP